MLSPEVETAIRAAVNDYDALLRETVKTHGFGVVRHETFLKDHKPTGYERNVKTTVKL